MARISLLDEACMTDDQAREFRRFPSNLTRALLRTAACAGPYLSLGASFLEASLQPKDRELVILRVGALSQSAYERMQHVPRARAVGWSDEDIDAIERGDQIRLGPRSAALLRFVDECVDRVRVSDAAFTDVSAYYSEQEIAEMTLLIGHYMMTARFLETLGVELDDAPTPWHGLMPTNGDETIEAIRVGKPPNLTKSDEAAVYAFAEELRDAGLR